MRSKTQDFSHEPYRENNLSYSVDVANTVKRRRSKIGQHATSEASNLINSDSSHDSFSENAQSKAHLRTSDLSDASGNVESSAKLSSCEILGGDNHSLRSECLPNKNYSAIKFDDSTVLEGHDDNTSSVSGAEQTNNSSISVLQTDNINLPADSLVVENRGKGVLCQTASDSLEIIFNVDGSTKSGCREVCDLQKPASYISDDVQNNKVGFDEKVEVETRNDVGDSPDEALCEEQIREVENVGDFLSLPEAKATSFHSHHVDGSDEADIVEHDVKVCDICGDAGREDLLAICCRCSDGAEHTYCMRERLDKVPEGDWLCEECNSCEETDTRRQDRSGTEDRAEKDLPCGREDIEIASVRANKLDAKVSDVEGNRPNKGPSCAKGSNKRKADDTQVSTASKRQALEPVISSPKPAHPSRIRSLSRDSSFKSLDSGKVKPTHFSSDTSEAAHTPTTMQTTGGGILKSNSFNFSSAKSKVKLVDEVPRKYRSSKEATSRDAKEGAVRGIGKSLSFKSINSASLSRSESKVKMLSPQISHVQDLKGSKHTNEKNFFERKNSFRSQRTSINPTTSGSTISVPKGDSKFASRGESVSLTSTNNTELKAVQSDSISISTAKPLNHGIRRAAEGPASTGEDEVPRARESTYLSERTTDSSISHPKQSIDAGASAVPCQKCKEIGHSTQFCTFDGHRSLGFDSSVTRTSRDEINKGNKLKAAIEAAMLKKPSIYRKNRNPSQSDEISVSSMNNGSAFQDQLSSSSSMRIMNSVERNSDANLSKLQNGTDTKPLMVIPGETLNASSGDGSSMVPSDGKHYMELSSHASIAMSHLLQMSAIPDHEYVWQGSFDVHRGRKTPELWDGFQAHLSTCASPKVTAAVNKFPRRVLLNEVPRLSAWPIQFEECGVREGNIALYFFAREYESYDRSYKVLLERMMRSDLALRGNIDGIELLIFPSNQLPEKSQRWNMLYFFWGVFRGKKESCLQQGPVSPKKPYVPDISNCVAAPAPALVDLPSFSSEETKNVKQHDCKPYPSSSASTHIRLDESSPMMLVDINSDTKVDRELQVSLETPSADTPMREKVACNSANNNNTGPFEWNNTPSLELALGGELKTSRIGKIDINLDVEPEEELERELKTSGVCKIDINLDVEPPEEEEEVKTSRVGKFDINLDEPPEEEEEEEALSLSLSFPVPEKEVAVLGNQNGNPEWSFLEASRTSRR